MPTVDDLIKSRLHLGQLGTKNMFSCFGLSKMRAVVKMILFGYDKGVDKQTGG